MNNRFGVIFGGLIACILLLLYASLVGYIIVEVRNGNGTFTDGIVYVVTTIGGLVSALVISRLAITTPGENPAIIRMTTDESGRHNIWVTTLAMLYLGVWLVAGLAALVTGLLIYPDVSQTLSDIGTTWLGLAVASGYAYFGLSPK